VELLRPEAQSRPTVRLESFADVREALRIDDLRQALYDSAPLTRDALISLHGDVHRRRRRTEQPLFSREALERYERRMAALARETLTPAVAEGRCELVGWARDVATLLFAGIAGIDLAADREAAARLRSYITTFSESATSANSKRDLAEIAREADQAWESYLDQYLDPAIERRRRLLEKAPGEAPEDVVTTLLRHGAHVSEQALRHEATLYMTASVGTAPGVFVATFDELVRWWEAHPDRRAGEATDRRFLQRAAWETIRLHPANPQHLRRAERDVRLTSGVFVEAGRQVFLDVVAANRDRSVFGDSVGVFDPERALPAGVAPWGIGFGAGIHVCMGQNLAGGTETLFGMIATMLAAVLAHDPRLDPADPPVRATDTKRRQWSRYPVAFPRP
jgi:cytochrome P450